MNKIDKDIYNVISSKLKSDETVEEIMQDREFLHLLVSVDSSIPQCRRIFKRLMKIKSPVTKERISRMAISANHQLGLFGIPPHEPV